MSTSTPHPRPRPRPRPGGPRHRRTAGRVSAGRICTDSGAELATRSALARAYRERLGATQCYVADLDAIQEKGLQSKLLRASRQILWRDSAPDCWWTPAPLGIAGVKDLLDLGIGQVIAGLESLDAWSDLGKMVGLAGSDRVLFSLDLHQGRPSTTSTPDLASSESRPRSWSIVLYPSESPVSS